MVCPQGTLIRRDTSSELPPASGGASEQQAICRSVALKASVSARRRRHPTGKPMGVECEELLIANCVATNEWTSGIRSYFFRKWFSPAPAVERSRPARFSRP